MLRVIVTLAAGNGVIKLAQLGIRSYLCNSLTDSNDACKAYMYVCVHIKCGHNINPFKNLQISLLGHGL